MTGNERMTDARHLFPGRYGHPVSWDSSLSPSLFINEKERERYDGYKIDKILDARETVAQAQEMKPS